MPCVYARRGDNDTWNALISANDQGVVCNGGWVARYPSKKCAMPEFDNGIVLPVGLDDTLPFDILIWQYAENCANGAIDCNQTNPNIADIQAALLNKLILPPSS